MKNKGQDVRTQRSRQLLADALIELMMEKPIAKITVNEVVKRSGVARTTFYAQFSDKEDFVEQIIADKLTELREAVMPKFDMTDKKLSDDEIRQFNDIYYVNYYTEFTKNKDFFIAMLSENGVPGFRDKLTDNGIAAYTYVFEHAQTQQFPLPPKYIIQYIVGAHIELGYQMLKGGFVESPEYMAKIQDRLTFKGLLRGLKLDKDVTLLK